MHTILTVPGINNSGPEHWQSIWERTRPGVMRVAQDDWDHPRCEDWVNAIDSAVGNAGGQAVIIAHSLGCLALAHWAARSNRAVAGLVLVAIPDPDGPNYPKAATGFGQVPRSLQRRPTLMFSSSDDPYGSLSWTRSLARDYEAELIELTNAGHINAASGFGPWPEGWERVVAFLERSR